jgi:hypothetical protein
MRISTKRASLSRQIVIYGLERFMAWGRGRKTGQQRLLPTLNVKDKKPIFELFIFRLQFGARQQMTPSKKGWNVLGWDFSRYFFRGGWARTRDSWV